MNDFPYLADSNRRAVVEHYAGATTVHALYPVPAGLRDHGVSRPDGVVVSPDGAAPLAGLLPPTEYVRVLPLIGVVPIADVIPQSYMACTLPRPVRDV